MGKTAKSDDWAASFVPKTFKKHPARSRNGLRVGKKNRCFLKTLYKFTGSTQPRPEKKFSGQFFY